jgi:DNA modification methylase
MATPYYADDRVTLYHGDCREVLDWLAADVLVTDPPYGIGWKARRGDPTFGKRQHRISDVVTGDSNTEARDEALALWCRRPALVFGTWKIQRPKGAKHRLIWHKQGAYPGIAPAAFYPVDEEIYVLGSGWPGPAVPNVFATAEMRTGPGGLAAKVGHPTPKPVSLMEQLIIKCPPGVIADPFAGSGSTLVAARNLGRNAIGVELEERYCEVIARRLAQDVLPLLSA